MDDFTEVRQSDDKLHVEFYPEAVYSAHQSDAAGRPVFVDVDFIRIIAPGDKNNIIETKVDDSHKFRFRKKWEAYKAGQNQMVSGWVLKEWPVITASQVKELNYHNIMTVEQLASISDNTINNLGMGMHDLRVKAKAALAAASSSADIHSRAVKEQEMQDQIDSLKKQLAQVSDQAMEEKRGPGRPAKAA